MCSSNAHGEGKTKMSDEMKRKLTQKIRKEFGEVLRRLADK